jgi:hypothetical protein
MLLGDSEARHAIAISLGVTPDAIPQWTSRFMDVGHEEVFDMVMAGLEAAWLPHAGRHVDFSSIEASLDALTRSIIIRVGWPGIFTDATCLCEELETRRGIIRPGWRAVCKAAGDREQHLLLAWAKARGVFEEGELTRLQRFLTRGDPRAFPFYLALMRDGGLGGLLTLNEAPSWKLLPGQRVDVSHPHGAAALPVPLHLRPQGRKFIGHGGRRRHRAGSDYACGFVPSETSEEDV